VTPECDYIRTLVRSRSAMVLDDGKEYLIQARLAPLVRQEGVASLEHLVARLQQQRPDGPLHSRVVEAMTINETSFFRDVNPYEALRKLVLPELIQARAAHRVLNVWSAACSTGQEPYSLAMTLRETVPEGWKVRIHATDLSSAVLERAKRGRFTQLEINRGLPAPMLVKHFVQEGIEWQVRPELRSLIDFRQMNLSEPWPAFPPMDIVFMRNVLIYFDIATKKRMFGRLREVLRPDGYLFLGAAETTLNIDDSFEGTERGKTICYRRAPGKERQ